MITMADVPLNQVGVADERPARGRSAAGKAGKSGKSAAEPAKGGSADAALLEQVASLIERIRPGVQADGGDVELVGVTAQGVARIRLHGACVGCPSSEMTLHEGIERNLRARIPGVTGVEQVH